jgi:hypothetical protein
MNWRQYGERLRQTYAKVAQVPIEEVVRLDLEGDFCVVYAPRREDLPIWTTDGPAPSRSILDMLAKDQGLLKGDK